MAPSSRGRPDPGVRKTQPDGQVVVVPHELKAAVATTVRNALTGLRDGPRPNLGVQSINVEVISPLVTVVHLRTDSGKHLAFQVRVTEMTNPT
jgi:hypothetical protein